MKHPKSDHGLLLCFLLTLIMNIEWTIPAWILLVLHFVLDISIWWFGGAMILWITVFFFITLVISWANKSSVPDVQPENKNPYSSKGYKPSKEEKGE